MDPVPPDLQALPRIALREICEHLRAPDFLALSSASRLLRDVAAESRAWKSLCDARWGAEGLNTHVCPHPADTCDYKALYLSSNGWRRPLRPCEPPPGPPHSGGAAAAAVGPDGAAHLLSIQASLFGNILASDPSPGSFQLHRRAFFAALPPAWMGEPLAAALIDPGAGLFAMGDARGGVHLVRRDVSGNPWAGLADLDLISFHGDGPGVDYPVTCVTPHAPSASLAALWDRGEAGGWRPATWHARGGVKVLDVAAPGAVAAVGVKGAMAEVFDHYELCTIASLDLKGEGGGFEWVGGSVKLCQDRGDSSGGACPRCHPALPASLCHHQHRSSQAALLFFDLRAGGRPGAVAARHPLPHRSLFPRVETVRGGEVLLISSAGVPLAAWDRRKLGAGPVAAPALAGPGDPSDRRTEALCLSVWGGAVAGRADDGWIGVWDLETVMGWGGAVGGSGGSGGNGGACSWAAALKGRGDRGEVRGGGKRGLAPAAAVAAPPPQPTHPGDDKPPRTAVWLGPDWVAANAGGTLACFRLEPGAWGGGAEGAPDGGR